MHKHALYLQLIGGYVVLVFGSGVVTKIRNTNDHFQTTPSKRINPVVRKIVSNPLCSGNKYKERLNKNHDKKILLDDKRQITKHEIIKIHCIVCQIYLCR